MSRVARAVQHQLSTLGHMKVAMLTSKILARAKAKATMSRRILSSTYVYETA